MKSQTLLAALALACLTSSAADAPRQINLLSTPAQAGRVDEPRDHVQQEKIALPGQKE